MKMKKALGAGLALLGVVCGSSSAFATAQLVLLDNLGNTVVVQDNGAGDSAAAAGVVTYIGSLGGGTTWTVNVTTGISKPVLGSSTMGNLDLNSVNVSSGGAGELWMIFSDTDFVSLGSDTYLHLAVGGTTHGTAQFMACVEADNSTVDSVADCDAVALTSDAFNTLAFSGTYTGNAPTPGANFGLGIIAHITHTTSNTTSFDADLEVPEPGILGFFGFGLLGMGLAARRRRKA